MGEKTVKAVRWIAEVLRPQPTRRTSWKPG